jgi:hypothetical protein
MARVGRGDPGKLPAQIVCGNNRYRFLQGASIICGGS